MKKYFWFVECVMLFACLAFGGCTEEGDAISTLGASEKNMSAIGRWATRLMALTVPTSTVLLFSTSPWLHSCIWAAVTTNGGRPRPSVLFLCVQRQLLHRWRPEQSAQRERQDKGFLVGASAKRDVRSGQVPLRDGRPHRTARHQAPLPPDQRQHTSAQRHGDSGIPLLKVDTRTVKCFIITIKKK